MVRLTFPATFQRYPEDWDHSTSPSRPPNEGTTFNPPFEAHGRVLPQHVAHLFQFLSPAIRKEGFLGGYEGGR